MNEQIQRGIRVALAKRNLRVEQAAANAGIAASTINRFLAGSDIRLSSLMAFFKDGLKYDFMTVLKFGKDE